MHSTIKLVFAGLLLSATLGAAHAQDVGSTTEKAIVALENRWLEAYRTNNPTLAAPMMAEKFVETGSDGSVSDKAQFLDGLKKTKFQRADYEQVKVTVFGTTAIASGGFMGVTIDEHGKPVSEHSRWTDTWVKMPNGQWQCVASQDTPILQ